MKLKVHIAVRDPDRRRRIASLLRADSDIVLTGDADQADLTVEETQTAVAQQLGATGPSAITLREMEVLRLMAQGFGNKRIAGELGISTHTAKFHVASVMERLGVHSRAEAVSVGLRTGLLPL